MITFDTQRAFLIPDEGRDAYFEMMERLIEIAPRLCSSANFDDAWDVSNDPIVVVDTSYFGKKTMNWIEQAFKNMGAKDITDTLTIQPRKPVG